MTNYQHAYTDMDGIEIRKGYLRYMHVIHRNNHDDDDDDDEDNNNNNDSFVRSFIHSFIKDLSTVH